MHILASLGEILLPERYRDLPANVTDSKEGEKPT